MLVFFLTGAATQSASTDQKSSPLVGTWKLVSEKWNDAQEFTAVESGAPGGENGNKIAVGSSCSECGITCRLLDATRLAELNHPARSGCVIASAGEWQSGYGQGDLPPENSPSYGLQKFFYS